MTPPQERSYWRRWSSVCAEQGWRNNDSGRRHACHAQALGEAKSHKVMTNDEITKVFALFDHLSNPDNFNAALRVSEHEVDPNAARRAELIRSIERLGAAIYAAQGKVGAGVDGYVGTISLDVNGTRNWRDLPIWQPGPRGSRRHHDLTNLRNTLKSRLSKLLTGLKGKAFDTLPHAVRSWSLDLSNDQIIAAIIRGYQKNPDEPEQIDESEPVGFEEQAPVSESIPF